MNRSTLQPPTPPPPPHSSAPVPPPRGVLVDPKLSVAQPLEDLLEDLIAAHERLLDQARRHRDALAAADPAGIAACIQSQNQTVQQIAGLERERMALVATAVERTGLDPKQPTLTAIVARLPVAARERLKALGDQLRTLLQALHREHEVLRMAAEALAAHMDGLMHQIGRKLSHTGTYERPRTGRVVHSGPSAQVLTALDMTS